MADKQENFKTEKWFLLPIEKIWPILSNVSV